MKKTDILRMDRQRAMKRVGRSTTTEKMEKRRKVETSIEK